MLKPGGDQRLADEPRLGVVSALQQLLDRDRAVEAQIARFDDSTEAAASVLGLIRIPVSLDNG
jgi:hypothetical protein